MTNEVMETENTELAEVQQSTAMTPMELLDRAMSTPNFDPAIMSQLMDLQERWEQSEAKKAFNAAFSKMQNELPVIVKNANGHNCRYETLDAVLKQVRPALLKHGFAVSWSTEPDDDGNEVIMTCTLTHSGGHSISSSGNLPPDESGKKNNAQAAGSARTYLQRYLVKGILGLTVSEDDDGASAGVELIDETQKQTIIEKMKEVDADTQKFLGHFEISSVDELPNARYPEAINALNAKKAALEAKAKKGAGK